MKRTSGRNQLSGARDQEQVHSGESYVSLADEFFIEGKLKMRLIGKQSLGAARSAGRTMLAGFAAGLLAAKSGAQQRGPGVTALRGGDLKNKQGAAGVNRKTKGGGAAGPGFLNKQGG